MSASISNPAAVDRQRLPFSEWLTLRRHPLPEYRDSLDALPPSLAEMARAALLPSDEVQGALFVPAEYHVRQDGALGVCTRARPCVPPGRPPAALGRVF